MGGSDQSSSKERPAVTGAAVQKTMHNGDFIPPQPLDQPCRSAPDAASMSNKPITASDVNSFGAASTDLFRGSRCDDITYYRPAVAVRVRPGSFLGRVEARSKPVGLPPQWNWSARRGTRPCDLEQQELFHMFTRVHYGNAHHMKVLA